MADTQSNIKVSIDTTEALASIKNLQRQISAFHTSMAKSGAAANAVTAQMQQGLINSINATGKFSAQMKTIKTTTESFTNSLEKNKFSLGEYFRYAGGASKSFGKLFKSEFDTINKVARENVKDLQTQYIKMGRDANGAMKAIAVRPLSLDMGDLATKTMIASEKQALLNQLLKQGSTNLLNFGKNTQWAGRQLMVGFTVPLIAVGSAAAKTFMDMETQAIRFKKVYGDLFTSTEESSAALDSIKNLGKEFTKYGIAVSDTVGLASEAAAAGFKGVDLERQTAAATKLSILGQVESQKALETTIALQNAFSMSSADLATNIDFLNAVENQTVLSLDDMSTAIPKAAPVVQQLGGNVKDLAFFMTAMKEGGINASEGANALKSGLASMINPTGKASAMLAGFGINIKKIVVDNKGDLKKTVIDFATALNQLDPLNRAQAIEQMFGKFQFARLSTLFANVTKEGTQASRVLNLAGSSVQDLAALSEKELGMTSESAMNKFKASVENLKLALVPVGEEFLKAVTPIAEFVTKILDRFNNLGDGTKKIIVTITAIVAGLGPVLLMTFGLLANGLANIIKGFTAMKTLFNRTGQSSATLGTEVRYMTLEQRNAAAVAASLDQVHRNLAQTFTAEAASVDRLTAAYARAITAQSQFMPTGIPLGRGPIKKRAKGKPAIVGGTGNKDSELAYLMPGETVIPTDMSNKYGGLINGMINDSIPGYANGKVSMYPEYALRLQDAAENMGQRSGTTGLANVLSPLALRMGEARGIAPTASQISAGSFDAIYKEYEKITTDFVDKLNTEYQTTFKDIKDENERMQKSWTSAGKAVETQVNSIKSEAEKNVARKTFGLSQDEYGTIPTDSREVGGTNPNRARRGAFRSKLTGYRSYTAIRPGAKKLYSRMTGLSSTSLQMGHVFGPREQDISTLQNDPRKTGAVDSAAKILARGKKDGKVYEKGVQESTKDPYVSSRERQSPHPLAAKDGKDDAIAYEKAKTKQLTQSGKKRRVATRAQGAAAIGPEMPVGATELGLVGLSNEEKRKLKKQRAKEARVAKLKKAKSKVGRVQGGLGLIGANMALSAAPDFAGKDIIQSTMTGATMGMMFGPWGAAAGGAIGLVTNAMGKLIANEKLHAAIAKSTFTTSATEVSIFGGKILDASLKLQNIGIVVNGLTSKFGNLGPQIQMFVDMVNKLDKEDPLKLFIEGLKESKFTSLVGEIRTKISTEIANGTIDIKDAQKYVMAYLAAAGRASEFAKVWESVSLSVSTSTKATTTAFDKLYKQVEMDLYLGELNIAGSGIDKQFVDSVTNAAAAYDDLAPSLQIVSDQMLNFAGIMSNGSLKIEDYNSRMVGLRKSALNSKVGVDALAVAIKNTGNVDAINTFEKIRSALKGVGAEANTAANAILLMTINSMGASQEVNNWGKANAARLGLNPMDSAMTSGSNPKVFQDYWEKVGKKKYIEWQKSIAEAMAELNGTNPYVDAFNDSGSTAKAENPYLKLLKKEIDALKAKRDAQKDANDEVQREIDLKNKIQDLANQAVEAKISGNYIKAAMLDQESQNIQMKYNQETELRKKDAEIARLQARYDAIADGAPLTAAENAKLQASKKIKKASGGHILGEGTSTSDSIPALLSNGEYVIKTASVNKYGVDVFDALNAGKFAMGGLFSGTPNPKPNTGGSIGFIGGNAKPAQQRKTVLETPYDSAKRLYQESNKKVVKIPVPPIRANFATNSYDLNKEQREELKAIAQQLIKSKLKSMVVQGHADSRGGVDNDLLSLNRAKATAAYLANLVPGTSFIPVGHGVYKPLVPNTSAENMALNRRAELFLPDKYKTIYPDFNPTKHKSMLIGMGSIPATNGVLGRAIGGLIQKFANGGMSNLNYNMPSYKSGIDYIPHDQIAQLHKGERVLTAQENKSYGSSGPITNIININGSDLNKKEIAQAVMVELDRTQKKNNRTNLVR